MTEEVNKKVFTFKDILDDPGLAFRLTDEEFEKVLSDFEKDQKKAITPLPDNLLTKPAIRKSINSDAAKISRMKTKIDDRGKIIVAEWKTQSKVIDARRKLARDRLDALRDLVREPVAKWEKQEAERLAEIDRQAKAAAIEKEIRERFINRASPDNIEKRQIDAEAPTGSVSGHLAPASTPAAQTPEIPAGDENSGVSGRVSHALPFMPKEFRAGLARAIDPDAFAESGRTDWGGPVPEVQYTTPDRIKALGAAERVIAFLRERIDLDFLIAGPIDLLSEDE